MKICLILLLSFCSLSLKAAEQCKTLKDCSAWATLKTGMKYESSKFDRRSIKFEKDFSLSEGEPDLLFNFLLQSNDLIRIKGENSYQIIQTKDLKDFQLPSLKTEEIPATFDFYSAEFALSNREKTKNALVIIKKFLSKNGRVLEVADTPKIQVIDMGIHLNSIKLIIAELNK